MQNTNQLLANYIERINELDSPEEILNITVDEVRKFLATDRVLVYQFVENWDGVISVESVSNSDISIIVLRTSDPCFGTKFILKRE